MTDEQTKTCKKCGETKPLSEFYKAAGCVDGHRGECKKCTVAGQREHKQKPDVKVRVAEYLAAYRQDPENVERLNARSRERYATNDNGFKDKVEGYRNSPEAKAAQRGYQEKRNADPLYRESERARKQTPEYREWRRNWFRKRFEEDEEFRLGLTLRSLVKVVLKATGKKKVVKTVDLLGYSTHQLRDRIACQFSTGMSWANHGEWHIDHKKSVAEFIRQGITDPAVINMLCNLQPMWAADNIIKKDKWPRPANDNTKVATVA
jgi:hypothetical protein